MYVERRLVAFATKPTLQAQLFGSEKATIDKLTDFGCDCDCSCDYDCDYEHDCDCDYESTVLMSRFRL